MTVAKEAGSGKLDTSKTASFYAPTRLENATYPKWDERVILPRPLLVLCLLRQTRFMVRRQFKADFWCKARAPLYRERSKFSRVAALTPMFSGWQSIQ